MTGFSSICQFVLLAVIALGAGVWLVTLLSALFFRRRKLACPRDHSWPPVTLLKPVYGLEKNLHDNLRTACMQNYPVFQVVFSVQRLDDPAIPLLYELEREFGSARVTIALEREQVGLNGKINNLVGALRHARHEILVISDSDVRLRADYLKAMVGPLADPSVGAVSSFFRATDADRWYEQMELLTLNADHSAMAVFASSLRLVDFCFGASTALSKQTLASIGGLEALSNYLVEDNEMGQRIVRTGKRLVTVPYVVDTMVDLTGPAHWWQKQTYWDQNTRAAIPAVFAVSLVLRIIPLSLLFLALRQDAYGGWVVAGAVAVRMLAAWAVLGVALRSVEGLRCSWLIPLKDVLSMFWFARAFVKRSVIWRGVEMALTRDGRLLPIGGSRTG